MPKRSFGSTLGQSEDAGLQPLSVWVATGLSLAVIAGAAESGFSAAGAILLLAPAVYVLMRLRSFTPKALTTSDLVGAALGGRTALFVGLIQLAAYLLLAVKFARIAVLALLGLASLNFGTQVSVGWVTGPAIAAALAAVLLVHLSPARGICLGIAILVAGGVLVSFYVALAVFASVAAERQPVEPGVTMLSPPVSTFQLLGVVLAVALAVGFEVVTTMGRDIRSVGRPMGWALALTAGGALLVGGAIVPEFIGAKPAVRGQYPFLAAAYLGTSGTAWLLVAHATIAFGGVATLVLAAARVARRSAGDLGFSSTGTVLVSGQAVALGVLLIGEGLWSGLMGSRLGDAGSLLLLAVYAAAALAGIRIARVDNRTALTAASLTTLAVVAVVVGVPLFNPESSREYLIRFGVAVLVMIGAAAVATKSRPRAPS